MDWVIDIVLSIGLAGAFTYIGFRLGLLCNHKQADEENERLKQEIETMQKSADEQAQRLDDLSLLLKDIEFEVNSRCKDTLHLIKEKETVMRIARNKLLAKYCYTVSKMYDAMEEQGFEIPKRSDAE